MDKLTKDQKDEYATSFAALALYDGGVSSRVAFAGVGVGVGVPVSVLLA